MILSSLCLMTIRRKDFLRGVRVLPEFDAPAHVGNGWQFGESEGKGKLAVCVNQEPWQVSDNNFGQFKMLGTCRIIVSNLLAANSTLSTHMSTPPLESSTRISLSCSTPTCSTWGETR